MSKQKLGLIYLWLVPVLTAAIGFGLGPVSAKIYIPLWALNAGLMLLASRQLGEGKQPAAAGFLLFLPWLLFSIFAGMGPPPVTVQAWVATAAEQQTRYTILMAGGTLLFFGTALLKYQLQQAGENLYSVLAFAAVSVALPLFILNMAYWGYYLTEAFRLFAKNPAAGRPDWYTVMKSSFYVISVAEVALLYLGSLLFAVALQKNGSMGKVACRCYVGCSLAGTLLALMPPSWPQPFGTASYLVSVPAIPFIMYYLIGLQLLKK